MSERTRIGILGLGTMGLLYARLANQNPDVDLAAICDRNEARLDEVGKEFPTASKYSEAADMVKGSELDAMAIITPDFAHFEPVILGAQAGLHLLIEKPLAMNVEEAKKMVEAIRSAGVTCQIAYTNRWNPPYVAAKNMILSGQLGEVSSLNARINNAISTPTKMLRWAENSSPAWFLMTHALDIARFLSEEEVVQVFAAGVKKKLVSMGIDAYDTIQALFKLSSGTSLFIESSWTLPNGMPLNFDFKYEIIGTESMLTVDTHDQGLHLATSERFNHPVSLLVNRFGKLAGHSQAMFDSFIESVRNGKTPVATEFDGLQAVIAIDAVHRSLETGDIVDIK